MPKLIKKKRVFSFAIMVITVVLSLSLIASCNGFDINPFDNETTAPSTTTEPQVTETVSELPGKTEFTPTEEPPPNGAPLGSPAYDMFLHIDGLSGESIDSAHDEWIDVLSYSWGISQPSADVSISRSSEHGLHMDFTITKTLDKTSPKLALYCSNRQNITEAILVICRAEGGGEQIMEYRLTDLIISSVSVTGTAGEEMRPTEQISLAYTQIEWTYTERDPETGMAMGNVEAYWNVETNTGE